MSDIIQMLRKNHKKKAGGLDISNKIDKNVIAQVAKITNGKNKYIVNSNNSQNKGFQIPSNEYAVLPHIPLSLERYIIFLSGESGMGKSSLASLFIKQTIQHITKKIFYVAGTDISHDMNLSKIKEIEQIPGDLIKDIEVEKDLNNSLIVFDDIDNCDFHKDAIKLLNKCYETGRKFGCNIIYISHIASKANESKIYGEISMYITNQVKNNRMIEYHLRMGKETVDELDNYLKTDPFVCYNKVYDTFITDKKVYKL